LVDSLGGKKRGKRETRQHRIEGSYRGALRILQAEGQKTEYIGDEGKQTADLGDLGGRESPARRLGTGECPKDGSRELI